MRGFSSKRMKGLEPFDLPESRARRRKVRADSVLSASGATVSNRMRPLACAVGGEDEFCTVTGLALLVGFFGGPILGGYVALHH